MAPDVPKQPIRIQSRSAGFYVGAPPKGRLQDIPGGANADEQREEQRREIAGLSHEQIDQEKLDYLNGIGVTLETLERWAIERGHAQRLMIKLSEKVVDLQHDLDVLKTAHNNETNVLGRIADFLGLPKPTLTQLPPG